VSKTVEMELSEAARLHKLASDIRKAGDPASADRLEAKVRSKRSKAISRIGKRPKNAGTRNGASPVVLPAPSMENGKVASSVIKLDG